MTKGEKIKAVMESKNISTPMLAEAIHKTKSYIYQILRDEVNPAMDTFKDIADALGVSMSYLLDEGELTDKIYFDEPGILKYIPDEQKEWIASQASVPYIHYKKLMDRFDIDEMLKKTDDADTIFFLSSLKALKEKYEENNDK